MALEVAVYTDATGVGGGEISLGHLVATLPPAMNVIVVGVDPAVLRRVMAGRPQAASILLPLIRGPWDVGRIVTHLQKLRRLRADVVHANLRVPWSCWYGMAGGILSSGSVVTAVEQLPIKTTSGWQRWWKRQLSRRLDAHLAVSEVSARQTEAYAGLPAGSVGVIRNGVPDLGPVVPVPHEGIVLVAVGRLDPQKGFDVLLQALAELPDARVVLVGDGSQRSALEAQARELGVSQRVRITGWTDRVRDHLAEADVFVLPSRSEGFPLSIAEAMQAGLPVVATNVGGVPEAVTDGETGFLVDKDDAQALGAALGKLVHDPALRARLGAAGRAVGRQFTADAMAVAYVRLWERLRGRSQAETCVPL